MNEKTRKALTDFVKTVEATGGLAKDDNGVLTCKADPEWLDLAYAAIDAQAVLAEAGYPAQLTIEEIESFDELYGIARDYD